MPRERTGHSKHLLPTTQRQFYTWILPDGQYEIRLIIFFAAEDGENLQNQQKKKKSTTTTKKTLGGYCGSDHELLQNSLKLKKVGKTTRPLKYDLSQIPFNYTVEVTNRLKGLDLID